MSKFDLCLTCFFFDFCFFLIKNFIIRTLFILSGKKRVKKLILGSSSPYRKSLLERLHIPFTCISPDIDETIYESETTINAVKRLAYEKAMCIANLLDNEPYVIIGSDQIAVLEDKILGKPGNFENAYSQLSSFSGKKVNFLTSLCILDNLTKKYELSSNTYSVYFRELTHNEITYYLQAEQPFDCAGSFKCEGLGIALFEKMEGNDPNSLIGLPLIDLCSSLNKMGLNPLAKQSI